MAFTLYGLKKGDGEIRYIGITSQSLTSRLQQHLWERRDTYKTRWIEKMIREENLKPSIVPYCVGLTLSEANDLERRVIAELKTLGFDLVNSTDGGDGITMTPETCRKIGDANRKRVQTPETRKKISEASRGENNPNFGKTFGPMPKETREKIAAGNRGRIKSDAECKNISIALTGKTHSVEHRKNNSAARIGKRLSRESVEKREATRRANGWNKLSRPV